MGRAGRNLHEHKGVALLHEATGPASPFKRDSTLYLVLGDGPRKRGVTAVRKAAKPTAPIIAIDPYYRNQARNTGNKARFTSTKRVDYLGMRAEDYKFNKAQLSRVGGVVVVAIGAHTNVGAFVARLRRATGGAVGIYAVCSPCCYPGLRGAEVLPDSSSFKWQLLYPRGPNVARRPLADAEKRAAARRKARVQKLIRESEARSSRRRARTAVSAGRGLSARKPVGRKPSRG